MEVEEELQAVQAAYPELLVAQRNPLALSFDGKYLISVEITDSYPSEVPVVLLKVPWLSPERETEIAERARSQCSVGEPMLFALVSLIHEEVPPEPPQPAELSSLCIHPLLITADKELAFGPSESKPHLTSHVSKEAPIEEEKDLFETHFISGPVITDRKSSFQAHLARVQNQEDITRLLSLVKDHRKVGRATHNIWAYVISADEYDFNDDGRVMQVLQQSGAANVLIVVSRWYGGIMLGTDRFKHIMKAAWELLRTQGFCGVKGK